MTNEQIDYLKTIAKGKTVTEIAKLMNEKFHTNFSIYQIRYAKNTNKIHSGKLRTFEKGHIEPTKKPIGYERKSKGYIWVKVAEPSKFITKQRYIYEQTYGKIPKGYNVIFLDGDSRNFDINNLILISKQELLIMNNMHLYNKNSELTKTGVLIAKIIEKTRKYERRKNAKNNKWN